MVETSPALAPMVVPICDQSCQSFCDYFHCFAESKAYPRDGVSFEIQLNAHGAEKCYPTCNGVNLKKNLPPKFRVSVRQCKPPEQLLDNLSLNFSKTTEELHNELMNSNKSP